MPAPTRADTGLDLSPADEDRLTTVGLFFEAHAGLKATFERRLEAEAGLPVQWFEVLLRLARTPGHRLRMSELAAQSAVTPSGLTRVIDRLTEVGLVARESCPTDRRSWYASITPEGLRRIRAAVPVHLAHIEELVEAALSPAELQALSATLRKLRDAANPAAATSSGSCA
jgi:DNA-binding MarR family transcriptional regulator